VTLDALQHVGIIDEDELLILIGLILLVEVRTLDNFERLELDVFSVFIVHDRLVDLGDVNIFLALEDLTEL
jgi:hypothetical protein